MSQQRPTLVPAIFALLSVAMSCVVLAPPVHADPCIAKPNAPAPQGEHWYYRTDRAIGRQCWYLGAEDGNIQKSVARASHRSASEVQSVAPQPATLEPPPAAPEANLSTVADPPPGPEATQLPYMPPLFQLVPAPAPPAEQPQTNDTIDPAPVPAVDAASEPELPAMAQSSPVPTPLKSTDEADHTLTLAMIAFLTIAIFGSVLEVMRWLRRRKRSNRPATDWTASDTLYQHVEPAPDVNSTTAPRHIPPPLRSFAEAEKLAEDLQKILDELRTRPSVSLYGPGDLTRSG